MTTSQHDDPLPTQAHRLLDQGEDLQDVLGYLRANGCTIVESIKATMRLTGTSLAEAKQTVHTSRAWSDRREAHDAFHAVLVEHLEAIAPEFVASSGREAGS